MDWLVEAIAAIALLATPILIFFVMDDLPDTIPLHFDTSGIANGIHDKALLWILSSPALVFYILLTVLAINPSWLKYPVEITKENRLEQYANAVSMLRKVKCMLEVLVFYLTLGTIRIALGVQTRLSSMLLPVAIGVTLAIVGLYFFKAYKLR